MKSQNTVRQEIRDFVQSHINDGAILHVDWVIQAILASRSDIQGEDADFYVACSVSRIKELTKEVLGKYEAKASAQSDDQIVLPGFDYLQKAYPVVRSDRRVLVPVDMLTDEEIEARAVEYEEMAKGCVKHAKELREYMIARHAQGVAV